MSKRKQHAPEFKAKVALEALKGEETAAELASLIRISNTPEADFCVEALNEAIHKFGPPGIMNTDQGSQFTSFAWTDRLHRSGVRISPLVHVNMHCRAVNGWEGPFTVLESQIVEFPMAHLVNQHSIINGSRTAHGVQPLIGCLKKVAILRAQRRFLTETGRPRLHWKERGVWLNT